MNGMTGQRVREIRERFGETRERFAARLGVSVFSVIGWEVGRTRPSQLAVARLQQVEAEAPPEQQP